MTDTRAQEPLADGQPGKYQERDVIIIRPANAADAGFDMMKGAQVLIQDKGVSKVVLKSDVKVA